MFTFGLLSSLSVHVPSVFEAALSLSQYVTRIVRDSDAFTRDLLQQQDAGGPGDTHPPLFQSVVSESARSIVGLIIAVGYGDALGSVIATWGRKTRGAGSRCTGQTCVWSNTNQRGAAGHS